MLTVCAPQMYQYLTDAEHEIRGFEDSDSKESRRALLIVHTARARLASVLQLQVRRKHVDHQAFPWLAETYQLAAYRPACLGLEAATCVSLFTAWLKNSLKREQCSCVFDGGHPAIAGRSVGQNHGETQKTNRCGAAKGGML